MMMSMKTIMVYSESGGVGKTTTAVSLATLAAEAGLRTLLIDLDPRAAATKWIGVQPVEPGLHVGAVLSADDPAGSWAWDLSVDGWVDGLRVLPSSRSVSNREADRVDHAHLRLKLALIGGQSDLVVIDCPNRQGGPLIQAALTAADAVVYAATPSSDGVDGFVGAQATVRRYVRSRELMGAPADLVEAGLVVTGYQGNITPRAQVASVKDLRDTGLLVTPLVPHRAIVQEARTAGQWYGNYGKGEPVAHAYREVTEKLLKEIL